METLERKTKKTQWLFLLLLFPLAAAGIFLLPSILVHGAVSGRSVTWTAAFAGGFLTALTPCVYPVIPLAVSLMRTWAGASRRRAAGLSGLYVAGMAAVYTALGAAAGLGNFLFGALTNTVTFRLGTAALLWIFGAGMLGAYVFRLPGVLSRRAAAFEKVGAIGAFGGGALSGALAAGCTGPILAGILTYIGSSQSPLQAVSLMLVFSLGLGLPFFLLGTSAAALPKPGPWLLWVEGFLGAVLVATGSFFAAGALDMLGYRGPGFSRTAGVLFALAGVTLWFRTAAAHRISRQKVSAWLSVALIASGLTVSMHAWTAPGAGGGARLQWTTVKTTEAFDELMRSQPGGKPVIVDFHADWCADCRLVQRTVFSDPEVAEAVVSRFFAVRVDASGDTAPLLSLARRYGLPGVPGLRFFTASGQELPELRVNGAFTKKEFLSFLQKASVFEGDTPPLPGVSNPTKDPQAWHTLCRLIPLRM
jgi:thiol:disulfide interchange protein DsbD